MDMCKRRQLNGTLGIVGALALIVSAQVMHAQSDPQQTGTPAALSLPITMFGEVRSRSEWDAATAALPSDASTALRSRFGLRVDAAPGARVVVQVQDSRILGAEGGTVSPEVLDMHQGYLELAGAPRGV